MADVQAPELRRRKPASKVQITFEKMEQFSRSYDKSITATLAVCFFAMLAIIFTSNYSAHPQLMFSKTWTMSKDHQKLNKTVNTARLVKRAFHIMESNCASESAVFGPQILIDNKPWNLRHVYMCDMKMHLNDPKPVVVGALPIVCEEEHQNVVKLKNRLHPLTISANEGKTYTITNAADSCAIWNAIDLIDGIW